MVPAIPYSFGSVAIFAVSSSTPSKEIHVSRCNAYGRPRKPSLFQQRVMLPQSLTFTLMQKYRRSSDLKSRSKIQVLASVETDVATDEPNPAVADEADSETSVLPLASLSTGGETSSSGPGTTTSNQSKRTRAVRKSEMPPVKNEELLPGASFTGKVRSIQPFGAFVDFGAFTDGLVHVSNLSSGFVKDVGSFVSVGQEVKVKILEANMETGRISLTMRDGDETNRSSQRAEASDNFNSDKPRTPRKNGSRPNQKRDGNQKTSKFVKGQVLDGTVKNLTRSGAFINLPEGEEGFLPTSEESEGFSVLGSSSLQVGQEVNVRVLRITRGQVTLTMKKEEDLAELNKILNKGVVYAASNPFELAFRKNKDIASFLDDREKLKKSPEPVAVSETLENVEEAVTETPAESVVPAASTSTEEKSEEEAEVDPVSSENDVSSSSSETGSSLETPSDEETSVESPVSEDASEPITENKAVAEEEPEDSVFQDEGSSDEAAADEVKETNSVAAAVTEAEESPEEQVAEESSSAAESEADGPSAEGADSGQTASSDAPPVEETARSSAGASPAAISSSLVKQLRDETGAGMMDCKKALTETGGDLAKAQELLRKKGLASADKKASRATAEGRIASYIHDSRIGVLLEVNCETDFVSRGSIFKELVNDIAMQVAACPQVEYLNPEDIPEEMVNREREIEMQKEDLLSKPEQFRSKIVDGRIRKRLEELALLEQPYIKNDKVVVKDLVKQTIATVGENIKVRRFVRFNLGEGLEKKSQDFAAEVAAQTAAKPVEAPVKKEEPLEAKEAAADKPPAVAISAALVKQLREETGAGMMDCKKALMETGGDLEKAQEYLRKKGLSSADKKASRVAAEGRIGSYIHDSRIGVLIEVNCETDFVGRSEKFKELVVDLAMQVAACPQVQYVSVEEIPESLVTKEKEIEMQRDDLASKPENIREKIVEGRISKRLAELALLEQPFIKDDSLLVKDLVKQTVAALGENIRVRRFVRFTLGETTD